MKFIKTVICIAVTSGLFNCTSSNKFSRQYIADKASAPSGFKIPVTESNGTFTIPSDININDGISEDEAVSLALWNNMQFQADMQDIGIAKADVIDAGIISNPLLRYLSPNMGLMASGYINFALDFIWQRPKRVAAAKMEAERVSEVLVQRSFTLIRDVQVAYADVLLAKERAAIMKENEHIRSQMKDISTSRLKHGDISELEATTAFADAANAKDDLLRVSLDTILLQNRLNILMGFSTPDTTFLLQPLPLPLNVNKVSKAQCIELGYLNQPQLKAANLAIETLGKRLGWEKSKIISFAATLNYQYIGADGATQWLPNSFNPGIQMELPVFNRNQGKIARARAELKKVSFQYVAVRQQVAVDISQAYNRYEQVYKSYQIWNTDVLPQLEGVVLLSNQVYQRGDISYLPVLEAMRQLVNAKVRKAELAADLKRSISQLNYSIGQKTVIPQ